MPWEHCETSIADHAACPTCGKSKTEWTLHWNVTRTFRIGKSKTGGASELRFTLLDWTDFPVVGEPFVVCLPDMCSEIHGKLNDYGLGKVPSPTAGQGGVRFPGRKAEDFKAGQGVVAGKDGAEVAVDTEERLVLRLAAPKAVATLQVWQEAAALGGRTLLGSCELSAPDARLDTTLADLGISWAETGELPPFGTATITLGPGITGQPLERNRSKNHLVRSRAQRGGYRGEKVIDKNGKERYPGFAEPLKSAPPIDRGGDSFAKADARDEDLAPKTRWPKGKHPQGEKVFSVRVALGKATATLPVLHPAELLPVQKRYGEVSLQLHLDLVLHAPDGSHTKTLPGPTFKFPGAGFLEDANRVTAKTLEKELTREYGNPDVAKGLEPIHARESMYKLYTGEHGNKAATARWRAGCAAAADWVNAHLPEDHDTPITPHDVGVTFVTEGGNTNLASGQKDPTFDGYEDLGIDEVLVMYDENWHEIRDYLHPDLVQMSKHKKNVYNGERSGGVNESGFRIKTLIHLPIEEACFAVAAVVAVARRKLAKQLADPAQQGPWTGRVTDLPPHLQFYWTTTFYNTKRAPTYLQEFGLEFHDRAWALEDNYKLYQMHSKFNLSWRTATFRYFLAMSPVWDG